MLKKVITLSIVLMVFVFLFASKTLSISHKVKLPNGYPVILRLTEEVSSKTKNLNDRVNLEVARDIVIEGLTVIKSGAPATATVTILEKSGMLGKAGSVQLLLDATEAVDGQRIPLRATVTQGGKSEQVAAVAGGVVCCPALLLVSGSHAKIPMGTEVKAYTEVDMTINVR